MTAPENLAFHLAHRMVDPHWLKFTDGKVMGCQCGFVADLEGDSGYGDSVLDHFEDVVREEERAEQDRLTDELDRLLALVAAQAEQNAELRADRDQADYVCRATGDKLAAVREQRDAARAELSALRAADEYQRWAWAVVERDAARDAVARVRVVINDPARNWIIDTHNDDGTVEKHGREVVDSDDIRAALDSGATT